MKFGSAQTLNKNLAKSVYNATKIHYKGKTLMPCPMRKAH
ncbi:hypothetical protein ATCC51562_1004 [Campylobacter concisus ATCC 51562]|uniref:Uncharacterized protein n=1 Tax=Campylobacter concisus ATCC 51562 TaxID=1242969 RepID=U2ERW0_9BACT|nr:hypothetical protein ATCC51562_1004 [Campylobacter concisus ATCC 51562]